MLDSYQYRDDGPFEGSDGRNTRPVEWLDQAAGLCAAHDSTTLFGTAEGARLGARKSAEVRAAKAQERKKTLRDLLHDRLEEHAEEIVQCFLASTREGDWRAADALITRVYGKPQEKLEVSRQSDDFDLTKLSLDELRGMRNRILAEHPELANFASTSRLAK